MSTSFTGNSDSTMSGFCPPPPPPPPVPGQVPALRINTVEPSTVRRPQNHVNDPYEPPAAIQNAMMTKDKKPFTYTPGMGGKLDLSQIRSPRMARRVAKNANDEGIEGPPKSALEAKPSPPVNSTTGANLFVQPQVAVPVFPTNMPVPAVNKTVNNSLPNRVPSNASDRQQKQQPEVPKQQQQQPPATRVETKIIPVVVPATNSQPSSPDTPTTPTQVTLAKAPTPWLQNKNKPQEELPEWAKRSNPNKSLTSSPESPGSPPAYNLAQQQQQQPLRVAQTAQQVPQQQVVKRQVPNSQQQQQPQERVVPIRIEDRPSVFAAKHEPGHHQFKQPPSSHHQQRWGQQQQQQQVPAASQVQQNQFQSQQSYPPNQYQQAMPQPQPSGGGYIIPVVVEGNSKPSGSYAQQPVKNTGNVQRATVAPVPQQFEPGPLQSRSFRVLQKITDTDNPNDVDPEQLRKLQLTEDDRTLMNKFKEQVDGDTYLHQEEDPRYRGAAIPSRAFRFLQNMTDSGNVSSASNTVQRNANPVKKQNRNSKSFEEMQANLPPSEQQVPEPKKYTGSAIPSRSFRILQAMTAPESIATQENGQADDNTCNSETNVTSNQHQGTFYSAIPPSSPLLSSPSSYSSSQPSQPYWNHHPSENFWCYYPYQNPMELPYVYYNTNDGKTYACYPIYNHNNYGDHENPANFENNQANNRYNNNNNNSNNNINPWEFYPQYFSTTSHNNNNNINNNKNDDDDNYNNNNNNNDQNFENHVKSENTVDMGSGVPNYWNFYPQFPMNSHPILNNCEMAGSAIGSNSSVQENSSFQEKENPEFSGSAANDVTVGLNGDSGNNSLEPNYLEPRWNRLKSLPKIGSSSGKLCPEGATSNMNIKFEEVLLGEDFSKETESNDNFLARGNASSKELNIRPKEPRRAQDRRLSCSSRPKIKKDANERKLCEAGVHISVDNYTYESCSDSESTSSGCSDVLAQGSEGTTEKSCNFSSIASENDVSDSEMESDDSYLVFSTTPRDVKPSPSVSTTFEDNEAQRTTSSSSSSEENGVEMGNPEIEGDGREEKSDEEDVDVDDETLPKQLSAVFEDSVTSCSNNVTEESWNDEALDDSTTVSVSLPLRLQFSVSENNEDVTTVIVGDSTVKEEKVVERDSEVNVNFTLKKRRSRKESEEEHSKKVEDEEVKEDEPPSDVNFVLQKNTGRVNLIECETEFTVRRVVKKPKNLVDGERRKWNSTENVEENPIGRSPNGGSMEASDDFESIWDQRLDNDGIGHPEGWNNQDPVEIDEESEKSAFKDENFESTKSGDEEDDEDDEEDGSEDEDNNEEEADRNESPKNPIEISEEPQDDLDLEEIGTCNSTEPTTGSISIQEPSNPRPGWVKRTRRIFESSGCLSEEEQARPEAEKDPELEPREEFRRPGSVGSEEPRILGEVKVEEPEDSCYKLTPKLLSVQNSREETDDEDSGVTSDMSRIISEADTDTECSGKRGNKYRRTQTHSRLFRLLNDDSILEETLANNNNNNNRDHLELPLNGYSYNYDENSNCSSGLTSPDYSPCEQTWRRFQEDANSSPDYLQIQERLSNDKDSYFQTWKVSPRSPSMEEDTRGRRESASLGFGESRKPFWAYKTTVLCPRIKSSKNIPKALKS